MPAEQSAPRKRHDLDQTWTALQQIQQIQQIQQLQPYKAEIRRCSRRTPCSSSPTESKRA
jgi:hypothetical protein